MKTSITTGIAALMLLLAISCKKENTTINLLRKPMRALHMPLLQTLTALVPRL